MKKDTNTQPNRQMKTTDICPMCGSESNETMFIGACGTKKLHWCGSVTGETGNNQSRFCRERERQKTEAEGVSQ